MPYLQPGLRIAMLGNMMASISEIGGWAATGGARAWMAVAVTVGFAMLARLLRGVSASGAVAGAAVSFLLYASAGPGAFLALFSVFLLTWISTRLGYARKLRRGTAERRDGRTASQVLANLGVAAFCAGLFSIRSDQVFLLACAAALAEAAADTVSSEYGQAMSANANLITTWEQVPAGTDGGISVAGTVAGVVAASLVTLVCVVTGLLPKSSSGVCAAAAIAGMLADSLLGASLERKRVLNNDGVNFLSTGIAALLAFLLS